MNRSKLQDSASVYYIHCRKLLELPCKLELPNSKSHLEDAVPGEPRFIFSNTMIDCGASESFMDLGTATKEASENPNLQISKVSNQESLTVYLADGTKYLCNQKLSCVIHVGSYQKAWSFWLVPLHSYKSILGLDWLEYHNPSINWRLRTISFHYRGQHYKLKSKNETFPNPDPISVLDGLDFIDDDVEVVSQKAFCEYISDPENANAELHCCILKSVAHLNRIAADGSKMDSMVNKPPTVRIQEHIDSIEDLQIRNMFNEYEDICRDSEFNKESDIPDTAPVFSIPLTPGNTEPTNQPARKTTTQQLVLLKERLKAYLENGLITPSSSPWGAAILWVPKKDGGIRMCIDWRKLNLKTVKDTYVLPRIDTLIDQLREAEYFTSLDMQSGYHQCKIAPEDQAKTAFNTRYGSYEWKVLSFGMCNAPSFFQRYLNTILTEFIDDFVVIYIDDCLVFSKNLEDHRIHLRKVLERLRKHRILLQISKCIIAKTEVVYLGHTISHGKTYPMSNKVKAIQNWPDLKDVPDVRAFLGLLRFYARYIEKFADMVEPLQNLIKQDTVWRWGKAEQLAFAQCKVALTSKPVLQIPDPSLPFIINPDGSKLGTGGVLMQDQGNGIKPCAYFSKKLSDTERKYSATNLEFLAMVRCLQEWEYYIRSYSGPSVVWTDHKALTYFFSKPEVHDRETRQLDWLARFNLLILYIPGKVNLVSDALSRINEMREETKVRRLTVDELVAKAEAKANQVSDGMLARLQCGLCVIDTVKALAGDDPMLVDDTLISQLQNSYAQDLLASQILKGEHGQHHISGEAYHISADFPYKVYNGTIWYEVPESDAIDSKHLLLYITESLRESVIHDCHDLPGMGHLGMARTLEKVRRRFYWKTIRADVNEYVGTCRKCQHNKPSHQKTYGNPTPLKVATNKWADVAMDRIIGLQPNDRGDNAIIVFVDRLTKQAHFVPSTGECTAIQYADAYIREVMKHHGMARSFVSDRDSLLVSKFWTEFTTLLRIKHKFSTAGHPQTDGQSEVTIRSLKEMLRHFVNASHTDWHLWLPILEFAYNDSVHSSTGYTPFFLQYGMNPMSIIDLIVSAARHKADSGRSYETGTHEMFDNMAKALKKAKHSLELTRTKYIKRNIKQFKASPILAPGDLVSIDIKHFKSTSGNIPGSPPTEKLTHRFFGPLRVIESVGTNAYRLDVKQHPLLKYIHPVINVSRLRLIRLSDRYHADDAEPAPVDVDGQIEYVIEAIINDRYNKRRKRFEYLTLWKNLPITKADWLNLPKFTGSAVKIVHRYLESLDRVSPIQQRECDEAVSLVTDLEVEQT